MVPVPQQGTPLACPSPPLRVPQPADKVKGAELLYQKEMEERQAKIERAGQRGAEGGGICGF